jgi:flagellar biosynthesis/type III secretory pathway protein FliH
LSDTATVEGSAVEAAEAPGGQRAGDGAAALGGAPAMSPAGFSLEQLEPSPPPPRDASERLLAKALAEAERMREQAYEEGCAEGRAAGHQEGIAETTAAALAMGEALRELHELRAQMADELERDAVELALALAAKILAGAFEAQPEHVLDVVRGALRRVADRRRIVVLVDPQDLEVVRGAAENLQAQAGGIELCEVQADRRVGRGGAVVRTAEGEIDATVETQLQRARELMLADEEPPV